MATSKPHDLFVGEMGAKELLNLHLSGPSLARRGGVTWQQDTAGNWIRRLEAAGESKLPGAGDFDAVMGLSQAGGENRSVAPNYNLVNYSPNMISWRDHF